MDKFHFIAGVDEAGRGPLAGPVSAAAVCLPIGYLNSQINDSKKLSEKKREELFQEIQQVSLAYSICFISPAEIDQINILQASLKAMFQAATEVQQQLNAKYPDSSVHFLVDGNFALRDPLSSEALVKGDQREQCIGAASILAKVARDREMLILDQKFPGYGLAVHKGYPTKFHRQKIAELGPAEIHRRSFAGVREFF